MTRSFLSCSDLNAGELELIFGRIKEIKAKVKQRERLSTLENRVVGLLFEKPSTRTSAGFEVATLRLGGHPLYFSSSELQLSRGEPIKDTARVLGADMDAIVARVYAHRTVVELAEYAGIPVINGLSDLEHPTQIVADLFTVREVMGNLNGLKLAYIGDGDNVCNSLLLGTATVGMDMTAACPKNYYPDQQIVRKAKEIARGTESMLDVVEKPEEAVRDADVLYTDVWVSMGEEGQTKERMETFRGYQVNSELLALANSGAVVMHCLPAHRGLEITDDVIEGDNSIVWRQAENKLYGAAGVLEFFLRQNAQGV